MIYLVVSALLFAINNALWKWVVNDYYPLQVIFKRSIITVFIGFSVVLFSYDNQIFYITLTQAAFVNLACLIGALGLVFMIYALKKSSLSMFIHYSLFGATGSATYLYFIENIVPNNYFTGLICLSLGFVFYLLPQRNNLKKNSLITHCLFFLMTICFSLSAIMQWYNLRTYDYVFLVFNQEIMVLLVSCILLHTKKQPLITFFKLDYIWLQAVVVFLAMITGFYGLKLEDPFISSIVNLSTPIFTMVFAVFFLNEKFYPRYIISLILVVSGAWLLS
jgi:drug/metabolite transporter (DMT)-like permease